MKPPYRADHVGSLLRPQALLDARAAYDRQEISAEQLRATEDEAILAVLDLQRQIGLDVLSDGEYRRSDWAGDFAASVDGYVQATMPITFEWRMPDGQPAQSDAVRDALANMPQQSGRVVGARLRQRRRLTEHEAGFLRAHAGGPFKITQPAASYIVSRGYKPGVTDRVYGSRAELMDDVVGIVGGEVRALAADGVPYVQIDNPHYGDYVDPRMPERMRSAGIDPEAALREDVAGDNACLQGVDRERVTLAMHICRGNARSAWSAQGGYEPIAEQVFNGLDVDRFLLEYDSERAGSFEPLRFMPRGKQVMLGLITTKVGTLEAQDDLLRRIEEASRYVPTENLALGPQCGFASVREGNLLSWDDQQRKLELVVDTARKVWG
jgi:5-methyltetrahydropteroyltriglutamate--homocysteine methyltransferase